MANNQDRLRDPIWQFIGVIISILAFFAAFLTMPSSSQGITLIVVSFTLIIVTFVFARRSGSIGLIIFTFFIAISLIFYYFIINTMIKNKVPFIVNNLYLVGYNVFAPKSVMGLSIIIIGFMLFITVSIMFCIYSFKKRDYLFLLAFSTMLIAVLCESISGLYLDNFKANEYFALILPYPKTVLGILLDFLVVLGYLLLLYSSFFAREKK